MPDGSVNRTPARPTSGRAGPASWLMVNRYVMLYCILYHDAGGGQYQPRALDLRVIMRDKGWYS